MKLFVLLPTKDLFVLHLFRQKIFILYIYINVCSKLRMFLVCAFFWNNTNIIN